MRNFIALRFSALVGRRGSVAAWNARAATATPLIRYLDPGWPDARSGVFPRLLGSLLLSGAMALSAAAQNAPGVADHEIKIGQTMPYTGPGARFSANGLAEMAYMKMINDQGGINGRKINLISVDDGFMPWRTGNETRKLIEVEQVAFVFGSIGTTTQLSVAKYLNERNSAAVHRERCLPLGPLPGDALHDRRRAPKLPAGRTALRPTHPQAGSKCQNLHPL